MSAEPEIVEWIGWAILTWSLPGLAFAIYTAALGIFVIILSLV